MRIDPDIEARVRLGADDVLCPFGCGLTLRVWAVFPPRGRSVVSCGLVTCQQRRREHAKRRRILETRKANKVGDGE